MQTSEYFVLTSPFVKVHLKKYPSPLLTSLSYTDLNKAGGQSKTYPKMHHITDSFVQKCDQNSVYNTHHLYNKSDQIEYNIKTTKNVKTHCCLQPCSFFRFFSSEAVLLWPWMGM